MSDLRMFNSAAQHRADLAAQQAAMMNQPWPNYAGMQNGFAPRNFLRPPAIGPAPSFLRRLLRGRARSPLLTTWEAGK